MRLGDNSDSPVLDLVQFIDPLPQGQPYPTLNNIGICRIAFSVDDIDRTYADLLAKQIQCLVPLKKIKGSDGATIGVVCFKDPDGAIFELISGMLARWKQSRGGNHVIGAQYRRSTPRQLGHRARDREGRQGRRRAGRRNRPIY
jgi:hypothetical protein